jgi:hypothetical protein
MIEISGTRFKTWDSIEMCDLTNYLFEAHYGNSKMRFPANKVILGLARKIAPPNWNVYKSNKMHIKQSGILNIKLVIANPSDLEFTSSIGGMASPIWYDDKVGYSYIEMFRHTNTDWIHVIIHEMAHIAVMRWLSLSKREFRHDFEAAKFCCAPESYSWWVDKSDRFNSMNLSQNPVVAKELSTKHTAMFRRAFLWMCVRACRAFCRDYNSCNQEVINCGDNLVTFYKPIINDLRHHRRSYAPKQILMQYRNGIEDLDDPPDGDSMSTDVAA